MFEKLSATETEDERIVRFRCEEAVSQDITNRLKKDSVLKSVIKQIRRLGIHTIEITIPYDKVGAILEDLRSMDILTFDRWLTVELRAAMVPQRPKIVPREEPRRGPGSPMDIG